MLKLSDFAISKPAIEESSIDNTATWLSDMIDAMFADFIAAQSMKVNLQDWCNVDGKIYKLVLTSLGNLVNIEIYDSSREAAHYDQIIKRLCEKLIGTGLGWVLPRGQAVIIMALDIDSDEPIHFMDESLDIEILRPLAKAVGEGMRSNLNSHDSLTHQWNRNFPDEFYELTIEYGNQ